jgi:ketosteroid isomerase-like protein
MTIELPAVIERYQSAHDQRDTDTALSTFTDDATVIDDGQTYVGTDSIRSWLDTAASEFTYTRTLTSLAEDETDDAGNGRYVVHNHLAGNFPGSPVDLAYRFDLADGRIHRLEILPR